MKTTTITRGLTRLGALALALGIATACETSDPTGPEIPAASEAVVVEGVVDASSLNAPAGVSGGMAAMSAPASAGGITVEVEGVGVSDTTDADGSFRLEIPAGESTVRIHFTRGDIDATLTLQGLTPGTIVSIEVQVGAREASVKDSKKGDHGEFEGLAALVEFRGTAPERVMALDVRHENGRTHRVLVEENGTRFHPEGDLHSFAELLRWLETDRAVEVEGEGRATDTGAIVAVRMKAEFRSDDHGDAEHEFDGLAALVEVSGTAPERLMALDVRDGDGRTDRVLVLEDGTHFAADGDLVSFEELLRGLESDLAVKVEGEGRPTDTGAIAALRMKAETREHDGGPDHPLEFEGFADFVSLRGDAPARVLRLEVTDEGLTVLVDVIEGRTILDNEGDYTSFGDLLAAAESDVRLEVEGEGVRQDDGSIAAAEIKAEVHD